MNNKRKMKDYPSDLLGGHTWDFPRLKPGVYITIVR